MDLMDDLETNLPFSQGGEEVDMNPLDQEIYFVCFFPPSPPPSQVLVSFALTIFTKT